MNNRFSSGFTLIELMIVVVIVAILAGIAYPLYTEQVNKTRRSDGMSALTNAVTMQERYFSQNNSYFTTDMSKIGGNTSEEGYYTLSVANPGGAGCSAGTAVYCFTLTATAQGAQLNDTNCRKLIITHTGVKSSEDAAAAVSTGCW